MNMKNWKKNLLAAAVLLVVCAGIYMNWMYSNDQTVSDLTGKLDSDKVMNDDSLSIPVDGVVNEEVNTITDYFAAVRLSRQQARDNALELLQEAMAYGDGNNAESTAQMENIIEMAL